MRFDRGIVIRGCSIATIGPSVLFGLSTPFRTCITLWALTCIAMIEWTALKRHLKVNLLRLGGPDQLERLAASSGIPEEYQVPAARTNLFIFIKCFLCSLIAPIGYISGRSGFHIAMGIYFVAWVILTLMFKNRAESDAIRARSVSPPPPAAAKSPQRADAATSAAAGEALAKANQQRRLADQFLRLENETMQRYPITDVFLSFALEYFGFVWVSGLSHAIMCAQLGPLGHWAVLTTLVSNWMNDIAALIVGKAMKGRSHALYPRLSPNKSLEGAVAGVAANVISPLVAYYVFPVAELHAINWGIFQHPAIFFAIAGFVFGIAGVVGDLLESLFKRTAGVKDTGSLIPGHGGLIDRLDGLLIILPMAHWIVWLYLNADTFFLFGEGVSSMLVNVKWMI